MKYKKRAISLLSNDLTVDVMEFAGRYKKFNSDEEYHRLMADLSKFILRRIVPSGVENGDIKDILENSKRAYNPDSIHVKVLKNLYAILEGRRNV